MTRNNKLKLAVLIGIIGVGITCEIRRSTRAQTRDKQTNEMVSTIAFVSTRDRPSGNPQDTEIYLMNGDGTNVRRLTNDSYGDCFPSISPDGKTIVFDSNRLRTANEPVNTSDLFLMNTDGTNQRHLTRG